ncbi:SnoaL-like protein [Nocardioides sp. J9]|uniref:nuclear transport factor 2 family protein n=1 Tax=unclassified Nocardioides TaxID=2615069 RepID=UPI0004B6EE18|nr:MULTISPECIES: nuclear transport factor 2 family protein [unclassified Nocardioides]TWG94999.1 SnoaL-like protein [Nocardioides sp. J9]
MSTPTPEQALAVQQLVHEYGFRNDHGQADRLHELVTEDYTSTGPMGTMNGREALRTWGRARLSNTSQVRHVLSNLRVFVEDGVLRATSYYVAYRDTGANPAVPASVGEYHDTFAVVDGELRLAAREVVPVFTNPDAPRPVIGAPK